MLKRIPLTSIFPNPEQPRKIFEAKALEELAASIAANGLMQPITVTPRGDGTYMIVAGERRWRAHCLLADQGKLADGSVLAHVRRMTDDEIAINAIVENLSRADISAMEEAKAFQAAIDRGYSVEQLAKQLGISQPRRISDRLLLLKLTPEIQKLVQTGGFPLAGAMYIAELPGHAQPDIVRRYAAGTIGAGQIKAAVEAKLAQLNQTSLFDTPVASHETAATVNRMEKRIETMVSTLASGWKDGECVVASKVDRNRALLMAEKLELAAKTAAKMARDLRASLAQTDIFSDAA